MEEQGGAIDTTQVVEWDPERALRRKEDAEVRLSRGFLRCRPERWFPGFATHWLTLAHALGVELEVIEVRPTLHAPQGLEYQYVGTVDDEPMSISLEEEALRTVGSVVLPGASSAATRVLAEYLSRRLLTSLALCWSGPESSVVRFDPEMDAESLRYSGAIKLSFSVNGNAAVVWVSLGKLMVERLDGLWRRQVQSTAKREEGESQVVALEVAQLAVPPSMLSEYTRKGTIIDLEVPLSDQVLLYRGDQPWSKARLCLVEGQFGFEMLTDPVPQLTLPEGTTRLAIVLGTSALDGVAITEISQTGAVFNAELPASNRVRMLIGGEPVADGTLCSFEGRFAVRVD